MHTVTWNLTLIVVYLFSWHFHSEAFRTIYDVFLTVRLVVLLQKDAMAKYHLHNLKTNLQNFGLIIRTL